MSVASRETLHLSSYEPLDGLEKKICKSCKRRRMYFCYDCRILMDDVFCPKVKLPCAVDVIKHPKEKNSKSTAIHCKIVAPDQTTVYHVPDVPDYRIQEEDSAEGSTVVVFPSPSAVSIEEYVRTKGKIKRFVVLDSTWLQVNVMQRIPEIQGLPCVSLRSYRTAFWRPQHNLDDHHLATIEAIYYALREYQELGLKEKYTGSFDDLLYWFLLMRGKFDAREEAYFKRKAEEKDAEDAEKKRKLDSKTDESESEIAKCANSEPGTESAHA